MEYYLPESVLKDVYSYFEWNDLRRYRVTDEYLWKKWYDYFCQDYEFRSKIEQYWGRLKINNENKMVVDIVPYGILISNFLDASLQNSVFEILPRILKKNRDFVLRGIVEGYHSGYIEGWENNYDVMMEAVSRRSYLIEYVDKKLMGNKDFVLELVRKNG